MVTKLLIPGEEMLVAEVEGRLRSLNMKKNEAQLRYDTARVSALQAQIDQLEADYDSILYAAVLI